MLPASTDPDRRPDGPRVIAGSGRSGTTWLLDTLAEANGLRPVFEPLHPQGLSGAAQFSNCYVAPDGHWPELETFLTEVCSGARASVWTNYRVRPDRLWPRPRAMVSWEEARRLWKRWSKLGRNYRRYRAAVRRRSVLVKLIRGNLMLEWIARRLRGRVVLILRHPGAVVESRLRLGGVDWNPYTQLDSFLSDDLLHRAYLHRHKVLLERRLSLVEAHTAVWCIENQLALERAGDCYTVVHYEHLVSGDRDAWQRTLAGLGLSALPETEVLAKPSQQSAANAGEGVYASATRWLERLDSTSLQEMSGVLSRMGMKAYEAFDPSPRTPCQPLRIPVEPPV